MSPSHFKKVTLGTKAKVDAYKAAEIIGCSYPHIITLIRQKRIKAKKEGKNWEVDLADVHKIKNQGAVTPRPRLKNNNDPNMVQIVIPMPKVQFDLLNLAITKKDADQTIQKILEDRINELYRKLEKQMESVSL